MNAAKKLRRLYKKIPAFTCKPGCTDCCGPVPFAKTEWERVEVKKVATCLKCPYSMAGNCEIYEDRPFICRLFGTVDTPLCTCPHGCGPAKKLSAAEGDRLIGEYNKIMEADR